MVMQVPLYNKNFEKTGEFQTALNLSPDAVQAPVVHQVVKSLLANRRQGTVAVKTKGKVQGGGKKPFKQKGTGRARQGSSRSPLMPGGGTAHGPLPRSYEQKINKKVMLKALHSIVADKFQSGKLIVLETIPSTGKTKDLHQELAAKGLLKGLLVVNSSESLVIRAGRNIPTLKALPVGGLSVYEAVKYEHLIMEKSAFLELEKRLQRELGI